MESLKLIGGFLVLLAIILGGYFAVQLTGDTKSTPTTSTELNLVPLTEDEEAGLGAQLFEDVDNPGGDIPQTNPFEDQANPFEEGETNPFSGGAPNPFE